MPHAKRLQKPHVKAEDDEIVVSSVSQEIIDSFDSAYATLESDYEQSVTAERGDSDWSVLANQEVGREASRR